MAKATCAHRFPSSRSELRRWSQETLRLISLKFFEKDAKSGIAEGRVRSGETQGVTKTS